LLLPEQSLDTYFERSPQPEAEGKRREEKRSKMEETSAEEGKGTGWELPRLTLSAKR